MTIMQGDAYNVALTLKDKNGETITPEVVEKILVSLGHILKNTEDITYDEGVWFFPVTQVETMVLCGFAPFDIRVKFTSGDVKGRHIGNVLVEYSPSKEVL